MRTTKMVGVREAKAQFSRLIHDAQCGREWVITQRGLPVAKIVPVGEAAALPLAERLRRLEQSGAIEPAPVRPVPIPPPLRLERGLAQRLLEDDRNR